MNKILDGEIDRTLILDLEKCDPSIYSAVQVRVNEKRITFVSHEHCYPSTDVFGNTYTPRKIEISFEKLCTRERDNIEIEVRKWERKTRKKRCDLGHYHEEEEYDTDHWQRMITGWEQFEQLMNWFQTGRYYDPRTKQAKDRGGEAFHSKERVK